MNQPVRALTRGSLVLALVLFGPSLRPGGPQAVAQESRDLGGDAKLIIEEFKDTGRELDDNDPVEDDWALIEVRNKVDRSIKVEFSGKRHYEIKVGNETEENVKIHAGKYVVRVSAGALKTAKKKIRVRDGHIYKLRITSSK